MAFVKTHKWAILLGLLGAFVLANAFLTNRPLAFYKMVQVTEIAVIPDVPELADIRRNVEIGSGFLPHMGLVCCYAKDPSTQTARIGWIYEEQGFLGMPFFASDISTGPTLYIDIGSGYRIAGISREQIGRLETAVGSPDVTDYRFAWYRQVWGGPFALLTLFAGLMWFRDRRRREEAEWASEEVAEETVEEAAA